jgi:hypothetical protein
MIKILELYHFENLLLLKNTNTYVVLRIFEFGTGLGLESGRGVVMKSKLPNQTQRIILKLLVFILGAPIFWGCSAVKFSNSGDCGGASNCVVQNGTLVYDGKLEVLGGKVDVLIVNDNSASMSYEQSRLSQKFSQFVAQFDRSDRLIDYRIALTTTDISSAQNPARSINQNGALQDGKLVTFSNGKKFLQPTSGSASQKEQMFNTIINRPETLTCEQFIKNWSGSRDSLTYSRGYYEACPTTDERGIYAANLVVEKNPDNFIRNDADLAIIFLADEDERSQMYWHNIPGFSLEDYDKAAKLVENVKAKYPQKTLGIHAFIIKDQNCLNQQNLQTNGLVSGSFGWEYYNATQATGGIAGDICSSDYTQQLTSVFDNIQGKIVDKIALNCAAPKLQIADEDVEITSSDSSITHYIEGAEIRFTKKLPIGSSVKYKYRCIQGAT